MPGVRSAAVSDAALRGVSKVRWKGREGGRGRQTSVVGIGGSWRRGRNIERRGEQRMERASGIRERAGGECIRRLARFLPCTHNTRTTRGTGGEGGGVSLADGRTLTQRKTPGPHSVLTPPPTPYNENDDRRRCRRLCSLHSPLHFSYSSLTYLAWVTHYEEQRAKGRVEVCALGGERAVAGGGVGVGVAAALTIIR